MMRRAILVALAATFLLAGTVMASTYTFSGKARWNDRLAGDFTTTMDGDITATANFDGHPAWVKIWVYNKNVPAECQALNQPAATVSCTITAAPAGDYRVEFWPSSGNVAATITVQAP